MIDLIIVLAFVAYSTAVGLKHRKRASRGLKDYFLAGGDVPGWKAGLSMAATQYAADTPLLATGLVATGGVFLLWRFWIYGFGYLLIAFLFCECWRRAQVLTDAELSEVRYSGRGVLLLRGLKAVYYGTVVNCFFLAMVLIAAVRVAEVFVPWHEVLPASIYAWAGDATRLVGLSLTSTASGVDAATASTNAFLSVIAVVAVVLSYSTAGGLRAVIATDVVQFGLMTIGTLGYAACVIYEVGGFGEVGRRLVEIYGDRGRAFLAFVPPDQGAALPFFALIGLQGLFWIGSDGTGYLAQRAMACRSDHDARLAGVVLTWVQVLGRSLAWLVIAVGLLVVYPFAPADATADGFVAARELTFVRGIDDLMPPGLRGVMLAALIAALASTVDSHLNWAASYWSNDLYDRVLCRSVLRRPARPRELVWVARLSSVVLLALSVGVMSAIGSIQATWLVSLVFGAGIGGVLMLRWLWEPTNLYSEIAAIVTSLILAPVALAVIDAEWLQMAVVAGGCLAAAVVAALLTAPTDSRRLASFVAKVRPVGLWSQADSGPSLRRLGSRMKWTTLMAASLFCLLTGAVRVLFPVASGHVAWGIGLLASGGLLVAAWRPSLRADVFD